jgi:hypothetical protein
MKYLLPALLFIFCSCQTLKVATEKNTRNTSSIGIEWSYNDRVNEKLQPRLDSVINKMMADFNAERHSFTVHKKLAKDKDYLSIDFNKGKIVSKGERIVGYVVSAMGLIATPIYLASADLGFIAAFAYWPSNNIQDQIQLSGTLAKGRGRKNTRVETGALFARSSKQVDKLLTKFSTQLRNELVKIETQLEKH